MKHLLNNMSEEEKNSIREQHTGGMKINTEKFKLMVETKLGDPKPFLNEQQVKGILGHEDRWYDTEDYKANPEEFDYDEEIEFGPDDWEDFVGHMEKDFPENKWSFNMKDRTQGKQYYDRYTKLGPLRLRKKRF